MTRLVNFGLGEICDRLSILSLKIVHGEEQQEQVAVKHFMRERDVLVVKLLAQAQGKWVGWYAELAAVNAALWQAEDELRSYREQVSNNPVMYAAAGSTAIRIQELNDRRAALVQQINESVGDIAVEKL